MKCFEHSRKSHHISPSPLLYMQSFLLPNSCIFVRIYCVLHVQWLCIWGGKRWRWLLHGQWVWIKRVQTQFANSLAHKAVVSTKKKKQQKPISRVLIKKRKTGISHIWYQPLYLKQKKGGGNLYGPMAGIQKMPNYTK